MEWRVYNCIFSGLLTKWIEKLKRLKGSLGEFYYELSFKNLPRCEMKMMGINGVLKTLV